MIVKGFTLVSDEKVVRAIDGTQGRSGEMKGGVGPRPADEEDEAAIEAWENKILAEYDRLGGLILLEGDKVKTGCFYDFPKRVAFANPKPILTFIVNDKTVEIDASKPLPPIVQAAKIADAEKLEEMKGEDGESDEEETPRTKGGNLIRKGRKTKAKDAE